MVQRTLFARVASGVLCGSRFERFERCLKASNRRASEAFVRRECEGTCAGGGREWWGGGLCWGRGVGYLRGKIIIQVVIDFSFSALGICSSFRQTF